MANRSTRSARPVLRLEVLEAREVPAVLIQVDYTYDTGFFANNPQARATVERVAAELGASISADLAAIVPGAGNTWTATFHNPTTGAMQSLTDPTVGANALRVFVGARPLGGAEAGFATTTGFTASGSAGWVDLVETRGWAGFAPWGGSIAFDSTQNWHFGQTTDGLDANELDFYSVAAHELGHVLGLGTSSQWQDLSRGGAFHGSNAVAVYGGPVPLSRDGIHWAGAQAASLAPSMALGQRVGWSALDAAALRDLGWTAGGSGGGDGAPAAPPGMILFGVAGANGVIGQYAYYQGMVFPTGQQFVPFPGLGGALRQTFGDFDGDGVFDVAIATPGRVGAMAIVSGQDGRVIGGPRLAHGSVTVLFAADMDGDGRPELITGEAGPGGPAVYVYSVVGGAVLPYGAVSAHGEPGRAAMHVADGDVDRTGFDDTLTKDDANRDDDVSATAVYTVSAEPTQKKCTCGGCQVLAQMADTDESTDTAWEDDLMTTVRVA
jgi:hypothetical protein